MHDLIDDAVKGGVLLAATWAVVAVPVALVLGRILHARESRG
ncbi:hypothetical protein [Subtercola sp. YIM 133946]